MHASVNAVAFVVLQFDPVTPGYCIGNPLVRVTVSTGAVATVLTVSVSIVSPPNPVAVQVQFVGYPTHALKAVPDTEPETVGNVDGVPVPEALPQPVPVVVQYCVTEVAFVVVQFTE